jgi:hypothetical protein
MKLRTFGIALAISISTISLAHAEAIFRLARIGYRAKVPQTWREQSPSSAFRLAQFAVPGASGASGAAECVFFYFGPGQGGSVDANISRWQSQFRVAEGAPVSPKVDRFAVGGLPVTLVELEGKYSRSIGMGQADDSSPYQVMRAAIIETPQGNLIVQLYGPQDAVAAQRAAFDAMVQSFARGD